MRRVMAHSRIAARVEIFAMCESGGTTRTSEKNKYFITNSTKISYRIRRCVYPVLLVYLVLLVVNTLSVLRAFAVNISRAYAPRAVPIFLCNLY
jgi:hypothetical protein